MINDDSVYISTNNWSKGYFYDSGGASIVLTHENIIEKMNNIFDRDWNSEYSHNLIEFLPNSTLVL